jgi:hypothetical protein
MPKGPDHVEAALARIQSASAALDALAGVEDARKNAFRERLSAASALIEGTMDRYFLKTRVCLPFARKCEEAAAALDGLLAEPDAKAEDLEAALDALEKAARTLDERSMMQGMAIT